MPKRTRLLMPLLLAAPAAAQAGTVYLQGLHAEPTHRQFIVTLHPTAGTSSASNMQAIVTRALPQARQLPGKPATPAPTTRRVHGDVHVVRNGTDLTPTAAEQLMRQLAADPAVKSVEVDTIVRPSNAVNDRYFPFQMNLWGSFGINAPIAWMRTMGDGVNVAVLDTGPCSHPDLDARMRPGYDMVERDTQPFVTCGSANSHGTIVAGTIAGIANNNYGTAGAAPNVRIVPVRTMHETWGWSSDTIAGIRWASGEDMGPTVPRNAHPVEVINLSLGSLTSCSAAYQSAIDAAVAKGITVVVSAGNKNQPAANQQPANCRNVITVGANDEANGARTSYSNYGASVHVSAPGRTLWTRRDGSGWDYHNGTSFSAPLVSGIVAMMQSAAKTPLTPAQVKSVLAGTATPFATPPSGGLGAGVANAGSAVAVAAANGGAKFAGAFAIVAHYQPPYVNGREGGCLVNASNGYAQFPTLFKWSQTNSAPNCGLSSKAHLLHNKQAVWDIAPVTASNGITVHVIRNRFDGRCLIRGHNGTADAAQLFLWGNNANKTWCGLANADALVANGQAAWLFEDMRAFWRGSLHTQVGRITQYRPRASYLTFPSHPTVWPHTINPDNVRTGFGARPEWTFELVPL